MTDGTTNVGKITSSDIKSLLQCPEAEFINSPKLDSVEAINYRESLLNCVRESRSIYKKLEKSLQLMQQKFYRQSQAIASAADTKIKTETEIIQRVLTEKFEKKAESFELEVLKSKESVEKQALLETQKAKSVVQNCNKLVCEKDSIINKLLLRNSILYSLSSKNPIAIDSAIITKHINSDSSLTKLDTEIGFTRLLDRKRDYSTLNINSRFDSILQDSVNKYDRIRDSLKKYDYKSVVFDIEKLPKEAKLVFNKPDFAEPFKFFCLLDLTTRFFTAHLTTLQGVDISQNSSDSVK